MATRGIGRISCVAASSMGPPPTGGPKTVALRALNHDQAAGGHDNSRACTAAQLVDGLESVIEATREGWPIRVAVVISAFDKAGKVTPSEWLDKRLPALAAMLASDPARVRSATFGVSAQGGRREDAEALIKRGDLHERAWAQSADGTPIPFSDPVRWSLGWG